MNPLLKKIEKHIDIKRKYKEEIEGDHNNASVMMHLNTKQKQILAKVNFLNRAELFMSESYIFQLQGNANKKTRK